jgi:hypothetical protein
MGDGPGVKAHDVGSLAKRRRAPMPKHMPKLFGRLVEAQACEIGVGARSFRAPIDAGADPIGQGAMAAMAFGGHSVPIGSGPPIELFADGV